MLLPMRDARYKLIQFKVFNRIYWTPLRLNIICLIESNLCWRCQSSTGDIIHMFSNCPSLHTFWQKVMKKTWDILGTAIPANYALLLLNITNNIYRLRSSCLTWLKVSQTTAKRVILRHWRENDLPSYKEWYIALADSFI